MPNSVVSLGNMKQGIQEALMGKGKARQIGRRQGQTSDSWGSSLISCAVDSGFNGRYCGMRLGTEYMKEANAFSTHKAKS